MSQPIPSGLAEQAVLPVPLKRKIAAILAADVAGYSRLVAEDEERTLRDLAAAREVFDMLVAKAGGRIFNTAGDSVMCEFDSAVEAVRIAIDIQDALGSRNAPVPAGRRLEFRIGISIGDVVERDGDLLGDGVNLASRLEGLAQPGGTCVSRSVHEAVANKLTVEFRDLGPRSVKNFPQPVHAFAVAPRGSEMTVHADAADIPIAVERRVAKSRRSRTRTLVVLGLIALFVFVGLPVLRSVRSNLTAWLSPPANLAQLPPAATPVEIVPSKMPVVANPTAPPAKTQPPKTTARTPADRSALLAEPAAAFASLAREGILTDARTLPELYHNARVYEVRPDRAAAQKSYAAATPLGGDFVDPVWRYAALLRVRGQDGRRILGDLARNGVSRAAQLVAAASGDPTDQRGALEAFAATHPDYAPADYLLAETYLGRPGGPTVTDRRLAFDALDRFLEASSHLPAFFVDRGVLDAWLDGARRRRAEIETFFVGAARPVAGFSRAEAGWIAHVTLPESATGIVLKIGERGEPLGPIVSLDKPVTGADFALPQATGRTTLYVRYRDGSGQDAGPFPIPFDPAAAQVAASRDALERFPDSWIQFRTDLPDLISYAQLVTNRCAIGRALIGYGDEPPTQPLLLPGCDPGAGPSAARSVLEIPTGTELVQIQIAYADGTDSPVRTFRRP